MRVLAEGGCDPVLVVLGCGAAEAVALLGADPVVGTGVRTLPHPGWADGLAGALRRALDAATGLGADAVVVDLVDLPDVGPAVVRRLLAAAPPAPDVLARAGYDAGPGHPVLVGSAHLAPLASTLGGDVGAQPYLAAHAAVVVPCGDLATGHDVDFAAGSARA